MADLQRTVYRRKSSPVSRRSSPGRKVRRSKTNVLPLRHATNQHLILSSAKCNDVLVSVDVGSVGAIGPQLSSFHLASLLLLRQLCKLYRAITACRPAAGSRLAGAVDDAEMCVYRTEITTFCGIFSFINTYQVFAHNNTNTQLVAHDKDYKK